MFKYNQIGYSHFNLNYNKHTLKRVSYNLKRLIKALEKHITMTN